MVSYLYDCPVCGKECCTPDPNRECENCEEKASKELQRFLLAHAQDTEEQLLEAV